MGYSLWVCKELDMTERLKGSGSNLGHLCGQPGAGVAPESRRPEYHSPFLSLLTV